MNARNLINVAYALAGLLLIAGVLMVAGRSDFRADPSVTSYRPSGAHALTALLNQAGYRVEIDRTINPKLGPDDLLLGFAIVRNPFSDRGSSDEQMLRRVVSEHLKRGGSALVLPLFEDFTANAPKESDRPLLIRDGDGKQIQISAGAVYSGFFSLEGEDSVPENSTIGLWAVRNPDERALDYAATATTVNEGRLIRLQSGVVATNRFLDEHDNAAFVLDLVGRLARPGGRIVLTEIGIGRADPPTLLQMIGMWAVVGWWQVLFIFAIVCYTLGKRFGLPEPDPVSQRGQRELLAAITDTFRSPKLSRLVIDAHLHEADRRVRRHLKVPLTADKSERDGRIPESLLRAFQSIEMLRFELGPRKVVQAELARLEAEVDAFTGSRSSGA